MPSDGGNVAAIAGPRAAASRGRAGSGAVALGGRKGSAVVTKAARGPIVG